MSLALEATAEIAECIARALFASLMLMPCSVSGARVIFFMRPGPDSSAGMMRSFFFAQNAYDIGTYLKRFLGEPLSIQIVGSSIITRISFAKQ